jgi:3-phenylpropionate/cinnamic acid dioxygenase small subunit
MYLKHFITNVRIHREEGDAIHAMANVLVIQTDLEGISTTCWRCPSDDRSKVPSQWPLKRSHPLRRRAVGISWANALSSGASLD